MLHLVIRMQMVSFYAYTLIQWLILFYFIRRHITLILCFKLAIVSHKEPHIRLTNLRRPTVKKRGNFFVSLTLTDINPQSVSSLV